MERKYAFNAFAIGNAAHGECFIQTATFAADHDSGKNLDSLLITLNDASMHANAVTDFKVRDVAFLLFFFDDVENAIHNAILGREGRSRCLKPGKKQGAFVIVDPANYNRGLSRS
jgi:hypothetical protein